MPEQPDGEKTKHQGVVVPEPVILVQNQKEQYEDGDDQVPRPF